MAPDLLADLRDTADLLTDPHQIRTPRWGWDGNRNKKALPDHVVVLPGLLQQLADVAYPGSATPDGGGLRPVPGSRPPLQAAALSAWMEINLTITRWCVALRLDLRDTTESNLRAVLGVAPNLPRRRERTDPYTCTTCVPGHDREHWLPCHHCQPVTQVELIGELRSWQRRAEVITGLRGAGPQIAAPCPHCGERLLRVDVVQQAARCGGCGAGWDESTVGVLARHISAHEAAARDAAARVRVAERERQDARDGRGPVVAAAEDRVRVAFPGWVRTA